MDVLQPLAGIGAIVLATCIVLYWYGKRMEKNPEKDVVAQRRIAQAEARAVERIQPLVDAALERAVSAALADAVRYSPTVDDRDVDVDRADDDRGVGDVEYDDEAVETRWLELVCER